MSPVYTRGGMGGTPRKTLMPKFAANLTMMFNEVGFVHRFAAAAQAGFSAVEFLFPYEFDKNELAEALQLSGLTPVLHNTPPGDYASGERGTACLPDRVGEFQDQVGLAVEYATALGCPQVHCLAGSAASSADPDVLRRTYVSNLAFAAAKMKDNGIRLVIEPLNTRDNPGYYLTHTSQARSIIEEVGSDNLWLQYDIYHMQIMEGDLVTTMKDNMDIIQHVQLADNPGRHEPGTGEINYPFLFDAIDDMGYKGWIGCEYRPLTTTEEGLGWVNEYLQPTD